jgi:hypothetical protein
VSDVLDALDHDDRPSLLDLVDNALNKGVVVTGDVVLGLAGVDLVYLRLSVMLVAMERLLRGPRV